MNEPITLNPDQNISEGLEYEFLKQKGIALTQALSGDIWTDYNEHDPGVTTLEQLCYALTDLSYRADYAVADLLSDEDDTIHYGRHGLFMPRRIFPCNPVTEKDIRKVILDKIADVKNVWLSPYIKNPCHPSRNINGLYDIKVYVPADLSIEIESITKLANNTAPTYDDTFYSHILNQVKKVYCQHRDLCEDVHSISILHHQNLSIESARITISENSHAETVVAEMLFNLGLLLAPEAPRYSLEDERLRHETTSEIFNGPLLYNGFIHNNELNTKATSIDVRDMSGAITSSDGLMGLGAFSVKTNGETYNDGDCITVDNHVILQLDNQTSIQNIRIVKQGVVITPDVLLITRTLTMLWKNYRRKYLLDNQYENYYAPPEGKNRQVETYYSIQNQFPGNYGIGEAGLASDSTEQRIAAARQFKGYLLSFDQVLANFFSQAAHIKDLYSLNHKERYTYFYQYLYHSVPDVEPLLNASLYHDGLAELVHAQDPSIDRRNTFLDVLLALYGEELTTSDMWNIVANNSDETTQGKELISAKLSLLNHLVLSTHNRGQGMNYLKSPYKYTISGSEIKMRIQLGIGIYGHRPLSNILNEKKWQINECRCSTDKLEKQKAWIDTNFSVFDEAIENKGNANQKHYQQAFDAIHALHESYTGLPEHFIEATSTSENFLYGTFGSEEKVSIVIKIEAEWILLGHVSTRIEASLYIQVCITIMRPIFYHCQQLYIVEHNLLRYGKQIYHNDIPLCDEHIASTQETNDQPQCHPENFNYNFTITAVISTYYDTLLNPNYRDFAYRVIRENTPAHIVVTVCFLRPWQIYHFEFLYYNWRHALHDPSNKKRLYKSCAALRDFLIRYQNRK